MGKRRGKAARYHRPMRDVEEQRVSFLECRGQTSPDAFVKDIDGRTSSYIWQVPVPRLIASRRGSKFVNARCYLAAPGIGKSKVISPPEGLRMTGA